MHNDGNVVPSHKGTTDQASPAPLARLPVIALQIRDKAAQQLRQGLQVLFDNADDTLFEMADRARDNSEQNTFFEAMRDLRLKRKNIERGFLECFFEAFAGLIQHAPVHASLPLTMTVEQVEREGDHERQMALHAMVSRALNRDGLALGQLTLRLSTLLGKPLEDARNPLGPTMLCEFFLRAGRDLGVETRVKLIILTLFERYVLSEATQIYARANQLLIATGVLPELNAVAENPSLIYSCVEPRATGSPQVDVPVQEVFVALQHLLCHLRGSAAPGLETRTRPQPLSTRDLLRLRSHLQQYEPTPYARNDLDRCSPLETPSLYLAEDESVLFDQALESVIGQLHRLNRGK